MGLALICLIVLPVYRLLLRLETGHAGQATVAMSEVSAGMLWTGALLALIPAVILARLLRPRTLEARLQQLGKLIQSPGSLAFASAAAALAGLLTLWFSLAVLDGKPNLIDAMGQLLQARYLAAGQWAGPVTPDPAFWHMQNSVVTPNGWVSQYPPGHLVLLAAGFRLGMVWAVGPLLMAVTVFFTALAAERLLPEDRTVARLGAALVAVSPFMIGLAGAYMNHITAAAFGAIAVYTALRAWDGHAIWAIATGGALGWIFATRPFSAVVTGVVVLFWVWWGGRRAGPIPTRGWWARLALAGVGASPFLAGLAVYHNYFFGSPFRFGYTAALGPASGLGFGRDPWGNWYGPLEALAYTSSDLVALNLSLLETPLPVVLIAGLFLIFSRQLAFGERVVAAWAILPILANLFYWHHGLFMGPRMLNEAAPAWALLTAIAAVGLVRLIPDDWTLARGRYSIRVATTGFMLVAGGIGFVILAPRRLVSYGGEWQSISRIGVPEVSEPAIVFVHGGWTSRIGMRLAAGGMRLDSVETAVRQNTTCRVHVYAHAYTAARAGAARDLPVLDFDPRSRGFLPMVEISPGNRIRMAEGEPLTEECLREIQADRNGVIDVSPLVWQGDLHGLPARGALYVRDLGPEWNRRLIQWFPERTPLVFYTPTPEAAPRLIPYDEGMAVIWGEARIANESEP